MPVCSQRRWIAALGAAWALACSSEEPETPRSPGNVPMAAVPAGPNRAPQIERLRFEPAEPMPGERVRAVASVRDPDGDRVTQAFRWQLAGSELADVGPEIDLAAARKGDSVEVWVAASDGQAAAEERHAGVTVGNRRPVLENVALEPRGEVLPGQAAVATPIARDADGDSLTYRFRWTLNQESVEGGEEGSLPTAGLAPGDRIRVAVVASDGEAESDTAWSGILLVGNAAPEIVSHPAAVAPGEPFRYAVEARDPEGDRSLRFELQKGPQGMAVNPVLGVVTWQPHAEQAGVHPVEIAVLDSRGARAVQSFELTVGAGTP